MDTKGRRRGYRQGFPSPAPVPDPTWRPAHRSRGEIRLRREARKIKRGSKNFWSNAQPTDLIVGLVEQAP